MQSFPLQEDAGSRRLLIALDSEKGLGSSGLKNHPSEQLDSPSAFCLLEACVRIF